LKIKSIEELEDKLGEDLSWRKKEILSLKMLIESDVVNKKILLRASIALLCAHFEGFVKTASNYYVIYIGNKKIKSSEINNNLVAMKMCKKIKRCGETEKSSVHGELLNFFEKTRDEKFFIKYNPDNPIISTNSNPSSTVLEEILKSLGVESDIFETKKKYIDYSLLQNRHKVVHGERFDLDYDDFISTNNIVLEVLDSYRDLIIESAESELYLKENVNGGTEKCT
jgi:hypothetical protein